MADELGRASWWRGAAADPLGDGYYLVLSAQRPGGGRRRGLTLSAFGPFPTSEAARFLEISAHALGLLPAGPSDAPIAARQALRPVQAHRHRHDQRPALSESLHRAA